MALLFVGKIRNKELYCIVGFHCLFLDKIVATEAGSFAVLKDGLTILVRPLIRSMFVGRCSNFLLKIIQSYIPEVIMLCFVIIVE